MASSQLFMNIHVPYTFLSHFFLPWLLQKTPKLVYFSCHSCAASGFPFSFLPITVPIHYFFFALVSFAYANLPFLFCLSLRLCLFLCLRMQFLPRSHCIVRFETLIPPLYGIFCRSEMWEIRKWIKYWGIYVISRCIWFSMLTVKENISFRQQCKKYFPIFSPYQTY